MAQADIFWTREEWTDFLVNECHIKRDRAHQIATKLVEQEFNTGKFKRFVNESMLNAKCCKEILLGIGFKDMDIFSFINAIREHISESAKEEAQANMVIEHEQADDANMVQNAVVNNPHIDLIAAAVINALKGKTVEEVIAAGEKKLASVPSGAPAAAAPAAVAPAAAVAEKKEEKKEEDSEDEDMGFGLFD